MGLLDVLPNFLSPQVKLCAIVTQKYGMNEFPHELLNDFTLRILGNNEIWGNCLNLMDWWPSAQSRCQNENFDNSSKLVQKNSD